MQKLKSIKVISILLVVLMLLPMISVYAEDIQEYKIVFKISKDLNQEVTAIAGQTIGDVKPETDPTMEGFLFKGWTAPDDTVINGNLVVAACWEKIPTYKVTFRISNTETIEIEALKGQTIREVKPTEAPVKEGYLFDGWTSSDDTVIESNMVLGAKWVKTYIVTFKISNTESIEVIAREGQTIGEVKPQNNPKKNGYVFQGWSASDDTVINRDFPVAAKWEKEPQNNFDWSFIYDIEYNVKAEAGFGGSITPSDVSKVKYGNSITFTITPDEGYEIESVKVNGKEQGIITEYTFPNVTSDQNIIVTFKETEKPEWNNPFTDISKTDEYYQAIEFVYENGLFKGVSETEFAPMTTMTRSMFVTVLGRLAEVDISEFSDKTFDDVVDDAYYAPYIAWAVENGIAQGYGDGTFGVDDNVTIEQAIVFIARFAQLKGIETKTSEIDFTLYMDINDVSDWALIEMLWALENDIYTGKDQLLNPNCEAERYLVAKMINNFCGVYDIVK